MKQSILTTLLILFISTISMSQIKDSLSYSLGTLIGTNLQAQGFEGLNSAVIAEAIDDAMAGQSKITVEAANQAVQTIAQAQAAKKHEGVKKEGEDFLAANKSREGVTTLPSGVQYEILKAGDGPKPSPTDQVTTHYHGMLVNGTVFDSSVERGSPATFPVNGVIMGWQEILPMMPTGSKWKVYIPYDKAYGERGAGADIPPFAALIFEIELISIN